MKHTNVNIDVKTSIECPIVPNYFRTDDGHTIPICNLSDDSLRKVAKLWEETLITKAHKQKEFGEEDSKK